MFDNAKMSERWGVAAAKILAVSTTSMITAYVKAGKDFQKLIGILLCIPDDADTILLQWMKASDSSGTGVAVLKAKTLVVAHATNNDNVPFVIDLDPTECDEAKPWVALRVTFGTTGGPASLTIWCTDPRYTPVTA